jgi:[ribosomal protein S5]-alanine N-acetyltransferase
MIMPKATPDGEFPRILETQRLTMRVCTRADSGTFFDLIDRNREHLKRNFAQLASAILQPSDAQSHVAQMTRHWAAGKEFAYGVWLRAQNQLVGHVRLKNILWDIPAAELSYFVCQSSLRQGIASEAILALLNVAFEQARFRRIHLRIIASNHASLSLAQKLRFRQEGLHRNEFRCGYGELHDVCHYSLIN